MPDTKTSLETSASALTGTEQIRGVQGGANVKITASQIATQTLTVATALTQSGTGAVARTAQDKFQETISVKDFGAVADGTTNDATANANAVAAVPDYYGKVAVPTNSYIGTARMAITRGIRVTGPGSLVYTPSATLGNRVQQPAGRDGLVWGAEYLYQWLAKISAGTAVTVRLSGDSTTASGYSTQLQSMLAQVPSCTVTLAGFSGKSSADWISTYLANDVTAANTVLVWHWGMNDGATGVGSPTTLAQFETNLRSGLTTYRASVPIGTGGIILMTPNASSDGTNSRDELRNEKIRQIIRNAAEDFQCAYFDTYGLYQDGYVGIGSWLDNPYADGLRGIHPQTAFSQAIAGEVFKLLVPEGIRTLAIGYGVVNANGYGSGALPTDAMSTYPLGVSIRRAQLTNGWPLDGFVVTARENANSICCTQTLFSYNVDATQMVRSYGSGAWFAWRRIGDKKVIDASSTTSATIARDTTYQWFESNTAAAAFAVTLPAPTDNDRLTLVFKNATGTLSFTATAPATNVTRLPTAALAASQPLTLIYNAGNTSWYPAG